MKVRTSLCFHVFSVSSFTPVLTLPQVKEDWLLCTDVQTMYILSTNLSRIHNSLTSWWTELLSERAFIKKQYWTFQNKNVFKEVMHSVLYTVYFYQLCIIKSFCFVSSSVKPFFIMSKKNNVFHCISGQQRILSYWLDLLIIKWLTGRHAAWTDLYLQSHSNI